MTSAEDPTKRERFELVAALVTEPVRRFLARRTDADTADDVLAETLLVCWRRLDDVPDGDEALPWAYAVARNALANAERGLRRQRRLATGSPSSTRRARRSPSPTSGDDRVAAALARLRPDEAELVRLWAWEQLSPAEIATVLDLTPNAVSIRLHRARGKLKEILEQT